jgi:type I restriction enzyme M protein
MERLRLLGDGLYQYDFRRPWADRASGIALEPLELIRKFAEQSNEKAGDHFTPREVIRLMVNLLFAEDDAALVTPGAVRTMYDPACGTGGMLSVAEEHLVGMNAGALLQVFGQDWNGDSYATCRADLLIKGQEADNVRFGDSLANDQLPDLKADYFISNPPFGVEWSASASVVKDEHDTLGDNGRFGAGLPRKDDGALLFLMHMWSKRKRPEDGGSRLAVVLNGSPLFTGAADSGESRIRRWFIENDWLEAIIALPDQMFFNTGISTYIWVVNNRKAEHRRGKVQLVNGVSFFQKMRKSLGNKRKELSKEHIAELTRLYTDFTEGDHVKVFDNADFGFLRITVERPLRRNFRASPERLARLDDERAWRKLGKDDQQAFREVLAHLDPESVYRSRKVFRADLRVASKTKGTRIGAAMLKAIESALGEHDEAAEVCRDKRGEPEPDAALRDNENVALSYWKSLRPTEPEEAERLRNADEKDIIEASMQREVLAHDSDAWVDHDKTKVGYEIPFTRHFYVYEPPRPLEVIEAEIRALESEIQGMIGEVFA